MVNARVSLFRVTPVTFTGLTLTVQVAVFPSSSVVTVIFASPTPTAVTVPSATVATAVLLLVHVTFLFVALSGNTVAVRVCAASPMVNTRVSLSRVTPVTFTGLTLTVQVAVFPSSSVVTVIFAVPTPTAVTVPSATVATSGLSLVHFTFLFVALSGNTVAVRVCGASPIVKTRVSLSRVTSVTFTGLTVTVQVAVFSPSSVVTVIFASPTPAGVTVPSFTLATSGLLLVHVTFLFVALSGFTVAVRVCGASPIVNTRVSLSRVTPVTFTGLTLTVHSAVFPSSSVVTVIFASPTPTAVTVPSFTVATSGLSLVHVTFLFVALSGFTVAVRGCGASPIVNTRVSLSRVTPVTFTGLTLTVHSAVFPSSSVVTVIFASPTPTAVTVPSATVATAVLLLVHVTFLFVALSGNTVAVRVCPASPIVNSNVVLSRVTPVTFTGLTFTVHSAVFPSSSVVTVIFASPTPTAVTVPFSTLATSGLSLVHVTFLFVALSGNTVAVRVCGASPIANARVSLSRVTPVTATHGAIFTLLAFSFPSIMECRLGIHLPPTGSIIWTPPSPKSEVYI